MQKKPVHTPFLPPGSAQAAVSGRKRPLPLAAGILGSLLLWSVWQLPAMAMPSEDSHSDAPALPSQDTLTVTDDRQNASLQQPSSSTIPEQDRKTEQKTAAADTKEFSDLLSPTAATPEARKKKKEQSGATLRLSMIREAGGTLAFQQGFRKEYLRLMDACEKHAAEFDAVFRFRALLLQGRVLPPVIRWVGRTTTLTSDTEATTVEASYRIVRPARIVTAVPTWRSYLDLNHETFTPAEAVLPTSSREKAVWQEAVRTGWKEGCEHARNLFSIGMARLTADYRGMLRFRMLADRGMVSVPVLAEGRLGIRVGGHTLEVDKKIFRITVPASFQQAESWHETTPHSPASDAARTELFTP